MQPKAAIAASLLVIGVTSLAALLNRLRSGLIDFRIGLVFGAAGMLGAYVGGRFAAFVPDAILLAGFGVMMFAAALAMLRGRSLMASEPRPSVARRYPTYVLHGLVVGVMTGLIGAGGGFLIVPALVLLGGMPMKRAVATSLLVIAMKSFAGFWGYAGHTTIAWSIVVPVMVVAALGSLAGSMLAKQAPQEVLRRGFAWLVMLTAAFVVAYQLPSVASL